MKGIGRWAALGAVLLLSACSKPVLDWRNAELSNGTIYESGSNEPFNGRVTNVPHGKLEPHLGALRTVLSNLNTFQKASMPALLGGMQYLCDADVKDGLVADHFVCRYPDSQVVSYEGQLAEGGLEGETVFHNAGGARVVVLPMEAGKVNGRVRIYFAENPEQLSMEADVVDNGFNGELVGYHLNGQIRSKGQYANSVPTGVWEGRRKEDGTLSERIKYEGGEAVSHLFYEPDGKAYLSQQQMWDLHRSIASSDDFLLTPEQDALLSEAEARYGADRLLSPSQVEAKLQAEEAQRRVDKIARGLDPNCFVCDGSDKPNQ
ncbi:toxin-antitoxin system YwqK family antitoxin [Stenotrophomonas maltophilia]|uniref:toxin-antitoxin system YwqK family antitoxin n=1 Tax=Stenotrophomonas maltophilia TaxID=40324 RepID=UPI000AC209F0|nr:hypothetical protein [Stenotrophomonas maltophilia]MBN4994549.1 hypothetical protein [Stenotrophomonas maltophilia]MBY8925619.1 hypothetical protein [Stenotrophomonas maltophilia]HDS1187933.1 hypothetical protein [Stenotrophomonas maltophilia]